RQSAGHSLTNELAVVIQSGDQERDSLSMPGTELRDLSRCGQALGRTAVAQLSDPAAHVISPLDCHKQNERTNYHLVVSSRRRRSWSILIEDLTCPTPASLLERL